MPKAIPGPFDAIDQMLNAPKAQPSNSLINLETQGYNNLWFSRAGKYDQAHKGTYGDNRSKELLAALNNAQLGFKPQISAGYANIGHSDGKGGEHTRPGVFDIGLSGRSSKDARKLKELLAAQGVDFLEEGTGTGNWHLHVRGTGKGKGQPVQSNAYPAGPKVTEFKVPSIPAGAKVVPLDFATGIPSAQQAQQANAARMQALTPQPASMPQSSQKKDLNAFSAIDSILADVGKPQPKPQPKPPGFLEQAGAAIQGMGNEIGKGIQTEIQQGFTQPKDLGDALFRATVTRNPMTQAGLGAASEAANLVNGVSGLFGGPKIPTGGLEQLTAQSPIASTVGRALPYAAGEAGLAKLGMQFLPGVTKAIMSNPVSRTVAGAGVNAAEGYLVDPGEAGNQGRLQNAILGGVIGGGVHGAGELLGKAAPPVKQTELPTPTQYLDSNLPKPQTEADLIRNIGEMQRRSRPIETLQPGELNPATMDAPEVAPLMMQAFKERGGEIPGSVRGNLDAQILGPDGRVVEVPTTGLKTAYEAALERTRPVAPDANANVRELPQVANDVNAPKSKRLANNSAAIVPDNAGERGAAQLLDASGQPMRRTGNVRELEIPGQPKPSGAPLELPRAFEPSVRELPTARPTAADSLDIPRALDGQAQRAVATPSSKPAGNVFRTPEGGEVYTHGRDVAEVQKQLESVKGQVAAIADIERHLQTHNPDAVPAIRNILDAGKNSEAVKFSYVAREAPGEPARMRDNYIPTHFTYETIKPATQRTYLRKKFGSDDAVISHLKQVIMSKGGSVDAAMLQNKKGGDTQTAVQINRLINALDAQTGGAYLKSPRVHGINLGETTRGTRGENGIRLDTIVDSSLTGQKVTPEQLGGLSYNNQIATTFQALDSIAKGPNAPKGMDRIVNQLSSGQITKKTTNDLRSMLKSTPEVLAQACKLMGL